MPETDKKLLKFTVIALNALSLILVLLLRISGFRNNNLVSSVIALFLVTNSFFYGV